jgi:hypothetical protein
MAAHHGQPPARWFRGQGDSLWLLFEAALQSSYAWVVGPGEHFDASDGFHAQQGFDHSLAQFRLVIAQGHDHSRGLWRFERALGSHSFDFRPD